MRTSLSLFMLLLLGACALPQQRSRTFDPYQPLEARITTTTSSGPLFHVNRPAYVAMFYIVPGSGVSMLYPGFGSGSLSGRVFAGSHFASGRMANRQQYVFTRGAYGQPRFYFLIASDRPLNVDQFGTFGDGLRSRLGTSFASYSAYSTMEDLAVLALPSLANDGSWTTDFYVDWPSVIYQQPGRGRVLVRCGGYEMFVAAGYARTVRSMLCQRALDDARQREDDDAEKPDVVRPRTREPVPAAEEAESRSRAAERQVITAAERRALARVSASSQLAPEVREPLRARPGYDAGAADRARAGADRYPADRSGATGATTRPTTSSRPATRPAATPSAPRSGSGSASPESRPSSGSGGGTPSRGSRPTPDR